MGFAKLKNRADVKAPSTVDVDRSDPRESLHIPPPCSSEHSERLAFSTRTLVSTEEGFKKNREKKKDYSPKYEKKEIYISKYKFLLS